MIKLLLRFKTLKISLHFGIKNKRKKDLQSCDCKSFLATAFNFDTMQRYPNERCKLISPVFISLLTIFGYLTIATFEPTRTTTIFDTKQPSLTEKSTENEGLSPATTRWH